MFFSFRELLQFHSHLSQRICTEVELFYGRKTNSAHSFNRVYFIPLQTDDLQMWEHHLWNFLQNSSAVVWVYLKQHIHISNYLIFHSFISGHTKLNLCSCHFPFPTNKVFLTKGNCWLVDQLTHNRGNLAVIVFRNNKFATTSHKNMNDYM